MEIEDLADRDIEVLQRINEYPQPTVTTLRESLHWASKNQHVHYRVSKLEEREMVTVSADEDANSRGPLPPNRVSLTSEGEELAEMIEDDEYDGLEERVDKLEQKVGTAANTYGAVKKELADHRDRIEKLEKRTSGYARK